MEIKIEKTMDSKLLTKLNRDVQDIHSIIEPELFKPYDEDGIKKYFDSVLTKEDVTAHIAYSDGKPAGYVILIRRNYPENAFSKSFSAIYVDHICVDDKYKRSGIGKVLIDFVKAVAKDNKINRIELNYWTANKNAGKFFKKQGFEVYNEKMCIKVK